MVVWRWWLSEMEALRGKEGTRKTMVKWLEENVALANPVSLVW